MVIALNKMTKTDMSENMRTARLVPTCFENFLQI
jgi:hypothetical protein